MALVVIMLWFCFIGLALCMLSCFGGFVWFGLVLLAGWGFVVSCLVICRSLPWCFGGLLVICCLILFGLV